MAMEPCLKPDLHDKKSWEGALLASYSTHQLLAVSALKRTAQYKLDPELAKDRAPARTKAQTGDPETSRRTGTTRQFPDTNFEWKTAQESGHATCLGPPTKTSHKSHEPLSACTP
jgi:hypothetical protein